MQVKPISAQRPKYRTLGQNFNLRRDPQKIFMSVAKRRKKKESGPKLVYMYCSL